MNKDLRDELIAFALSALIGAILCFAVIAYGMGGCL